MQLGRQFNENVADLAAYREAKMLARPHQAAMGLGDLSHHVEHEHGLPTRDNPSRPWLEFVHQDLHNAGAEHVPWVEHAHGRNPMERLT